MSIKEQGPMNRTSITIVVVVLLIAAGLAYNQGWFNWSRPTLRNGKQHRPHRPEDRPEKTNEDAVRLTNETAKTADTVTE